MKLFGDSGSHRHEGAKRPERAANESGKNMFSALFSAPIWKKLRKPLIAVGCVILFVLLVLLIYSIWEKPPETVSEGPNAAVTQKPTIQEPVEPTQNPVIVETPAPETEEEPEPAEESPEPTEEPVPTGRKEDCYTFVILVYDQIKANTDSILAGRMDSAAGTLDLVNIPRDTLVNVSWGVKKLNTVLASERNDMDRFLEHLGNLIGFTADCYAVADIKAVEKLVDCIGGVYYNVPRDMDYDDPTQDLHIHIQQGYQLLNGEDAVKVMRFRMGNDNSGYVNGDLGRIATQQDLLKTMASQFLTLGNIPNIDNAIEIFQTYVKTNMTANNIAFFLREFLKMDQENIRFHTMPGTGAYIRGGAYLEVDLDDWIVMLNDDLNPFYQEITADNLNILQQNGKEGAVSTSGETVPITSFYDFSQYKG